MIVHSLLPLRWLVVAAALAAALPAPFSASSPAALPQGKPPAKGSGKAPPAPPSPVDEAFLVYRERVKRPALFKRTRGRETLARTGDRRALEQLIEDYQKPEEPKDRVRALIADLTTSHCTDPSLLPLYAQWRAAQKKPEDAWLWTRSLRLHARHDDLATVDAAVASAPSLALRCAAIAALAPTAPRGTQAQQAAACLAKIPALLATKSANPAEAGALAQIVAGLLLAAKEARDGEAFPPACSALIATLESKTLPATSKRVVARHLARLFDKQGIPDLNPEVWKRELAARAWTQKREAERPGYGASFAGIPAGGLRFCYVIDCSDSMLKQVAGRAREKASDTGPKKKPDSSGLPAINWDKVDTRFDLARELVLASIRQLDESKKFAIVLFGDGAEPMAATPELVPASKKNVARVEAELAAMHAGPATSERPDGTLLGKTNLQGGLDRAFRITTSGLEAKADWTDLERIEAGADTVFLFSDGEPSWDDFDALDAPDDDDIIGDPETRAPLAKQPVLHCFGPYVEHHHLVNEVRRLNFFRGVEIHCVGTGEAPMGLLEQLAAIGLGTTKQIGQDK
ncbi:MAG: hypothetical protein JNL90_19565 [Planctomycetes bacterium]|nr:hypothetical protein [Planctomycetota bacterium]